MLYINIYSFLALIEYFLPAFVPLIGCIARMRPLRVTKPDEKILDYGNE